MIIPFFIPHSGCPHQCVFCNQKTITGRNRPPDSAALPEKILGYLETDRSGKPVEIAFYGGTFTALPIDLQRSYLQAVQPFIEAGRVSGIRLSTRPDCISPPVLDLLKNSSVRTVELGAQSLNDRVLTLSGRGHTVRHTVDAVRLLREYRFQIGLQLMPGLPGDSPDIFEDTIARSIELKPDVVRLYPALVVKNTQLEEQYRSGTFRPLSLADAVVLCKKALIQLEKAGIDVIRMGLQSTEELEKKGSIVAGPYHPAFRQLVESSIMLDSMRSAAAGWNGRGVVLFRVHPKDIANAVGQNRSNIDSLKQEFGFTNVTVKSDPSVPRRTAGIATE